MLWYRATRPASIRDVLAALTTTQVRWVAAVVPARVARRRMARAVGDMTRWVGPMSAPLDWAIWKRTIRNRLYTSSIWLTRDSISFPLIRPRPTGRSRPWQHRRWRSPTLVQSPRTPCLEPWASATASSMLASPARPSRRRMPASSRPRCGVLTRPRRHLAPALCSRWPWAIRAAASLQATPAQMAPRTSAEHRSKTVRS